MGIINDAPPVVAAVATGITVLAENFSTRIQLMDEIWGNESESGWETVTVHIGRLRKRFEGWNEFEIQSVRGLGYRAVRKQ